MSVSATVVSMDGKTVYTGTDVRDINISRGPTASIA